jgi:amino-acid N-acetyltransferase
MLHRSLESVYDSLREFRVAITRGKLLGCVAVDVFWANLAEVKSLAVSPAARGKGIGGKLIDAAVTDARSLGIKKLFALTYEKDFFLKQGFRVIDRQKLPDKVWRECIACPKADACDETAMLLPLGKRAKAPAKGRKAE